VETYLAGGGGGCISSTNFCFISQLFLFHWAFDSGASHHICNTRSCFLSLQEMSKSITICLGNHSAVTTHQSGSISLCALTVEALYVPEFRLSLISIRQHARHGLTVEFVSQSCKVWQEADTCHSRHMVMQGHLAEGLYILEEPIEHYKDRAVGGLRNSLLASQVLLTTSSRSDPPDFTLWHRRLAHLNPAALQKLGLTIEPHFTYCSTCILAKQRRTGSQVPALRTERPFSLLHSDSCGPLPA